MIIRKILFKCFVLSFLLLSIIVPSFGKIGVCVYPPYKCFDQPCDSVLECVMKKQRKSLKARLEDLKDTIEANTKQTTHQTKIIEKEVLAYRRFLERVKKESLSLKRAVHLSNKISQSQALSTTINTIEKGK